MTKTKMSVKEAAELLGVSQQFVRLGLQRKELPFGTALKMSSIWTYYISRKRLYDYIGIEMPEKEEITCDKNNQEK